MDMCNSHSDLVACYLKKYGLCSISRLCELYQAETRRSIRRRLLLILAACCAAQPACLPICLFSILPLELLREISSTRIG
ncbi:unnamed protein product [Protopolystoma xenopodis]|uniref:Uncharacterized protein n=1 Tax=Protopolystoma xenopodis TaxID=117903 RepID=A0A448XE63_9PLAT|nr:unnamed protein product [Protopolystoma xenopodis]